MNEFEKKLFADLQAGHSVDDIMAEFKSRLDVADKEYKAVQEKKRTEAEAQKNRAAQAKTITDMANRLLEGKPIAEDVVYVFQHYLASKWNKSEAIVQHLLTTAEVDEMVDTAVKMLDALEPMMNAVGMSWEDAAARMKTYNHNNFNVEINAHDIKDDNSIIKDFIQKIM